MKKEFYTSKKTFVKFDDKHFLLYLNEEIIEDFLPENAEPETEPSTFYAYSGTQEDGSTKIEATEATYEQFVSGLIAVRYNVSDELALHRQKDVKADDFAAYDAYCEGCKDIVREFFE